MALTTSTTNQLISQDQLCKILNRSRPTIWRWVNNNTLPSPVRVNGSILGWREDAIAEWLDKNTH